MLVPVYKTSALPIELRKRKRVSFTVETLKTICVLCQGGLEPQTIHDTFTAPTNAVDHATLPDNGDQCAPLM